MCHVCMRRRIHVCYIIIIRLKCDAALTLQYVCAVIIFKDYNAPTEAARAPSD